MLDRLVRALLPAAYNVSLLWARLSGRRPMGAAVAVWHGGKVLIVRHSYRDGYGLPGGTIMRNEAPAAAAARELAEETGIVVASDELEPAYTVHGSYVFEHHAARLPRITIDNREIVEAAFVDPEEARRHDGMHRYLRFVRTRAKDGAPASEITR